jgi:protein O-GlcNAc transferase
VGNRSNEGLKGLFDRASQLHKAGALDEAERLYRKLLRSNGDQFHVLRLLGHLEIQRGRHEEACKLLGRALRIEPESVEVLVNRGNALMELGRPANALEDYDRALSRSAANERLLTNRGTALAALRQFDEALEAFTRAIAMSPVAAQPYFNRGNVLLDLGRIDEALQDFDRAIERAPDYVDAHHNRGIALRAQDRTTEAIAAFDRAVTLRPRYVEALNSRRILFQELGRHEEAARALMAFLEVSPDFPFARGSLLESQLYCCDWSGFDEQLTRVEGGLRQNKPAAMPFTLLAVSDDPSQQLAGARIFAHYETREWPASKVDFPANRGRLRIAYISADFREHPVATLLADVLEAHDRERVETIGVSLGPDDGSPMRRRLTAAFDQFLDMRNVPTEQIVAELRKRGVDIAIDLMGFTAGHRVGIFAQRVAPVQVNYLGFAGTVGSACHDYILADRYLVPDSSKAHYTEQVAYLPDCYLAISRRSIAPTPPTRERAGLPSAGVVFCAFNNQFKIGPPVYDAWMRILLRVPNSVLWLTQGNAASRINLSKEAVRRGVDPGRIIFAPRIPDHAEHMARLTLADVFLDTYPYNAHATATDALMAGVPLITRSGRTFASRVAGSLLHAAGCPELIVETPDDYERMAVELALDEARLHNLKAKLRANVANPVMFDAVRYCRGLESTLLEMYQRHATGRPS